MLSFIRIANGLAFAALAVCASDLRVSEAVQSENKTLLRSLIAQKADVNAVSVDGTAPLHWSVEYDDAEAVDLLLKAGAQVDVADRYGMTPLFYAVTDGKAALVERLLAAGANANGAGQAGDSLLMIAVRGNSVDIVQALLGKGASVNATDEGARETPLMWAVRSNNVRPSRSCWIAEPTSMLARAQAKFRNAGRPAREVDRMAPVLCAGAGRIAAISPKLPAACLRCCTPRAMAAWKSPGCWWTPRPT